MPAEGVANVGTLGALIWRATDRTRAVRAVTAVRTVEELRRML
jgi:hypothetical protein